MASIPASTAREHPLHGVTFTSFVSSATGAGSLAMWCADFPPRTPGQPHTMSREEVLFVVNGTLDVEIGDETFTAGTGDAMLVPPGSLFRISNHSDSAARAVVTTSLGMTVTMEGSDRSLTPPWAS